MRFAPKTRESRQGHAMVELAVSAGVLVAFLAGTFQFGYTFFVYNQLVSAVGNGARYAAQRSYRGASPSDVERGKTAIRDMVVYGDAKPAPGAAPVISNLTPEEVDVEWVQQAEGAPTAVRVAIHGYTVNAVFKSYTFEGRPAVEFPYVGRYAPAESEQ